MSTFWVIVVICVVCCVVGFPFTWIYWKQADKWAEAEKRRKAEMFRDRDDRAE